jgi:glyoxylase I family protein
MVQTTAVTFVGPMHEGIPVSIANLDACIAFYTGVLGLERLPRPKAVEEFVPGAWFTDRERRIQLHLFAKDDEQRPRPEARVSPTARHTAWMIEDLEGFRNHLQERGVPFEEIDSLVGSVQLFVLDPEGHMWEFQERRP